jgi:hypothetical protein
LKQDTYAKMKTCLEELKQEQVEIERNDGARELALAATNLEQAIHWAKASAEESGEFVF